MNQRPPVERADALPTELSSPMLAVSLYCQYLCSGVPVRSHTTVNFVSFMFFCYRRDVRRMEARVSRASLLPIMKGEDHLGFLFVCLLGCLFVCLDDLPNKGTLAKPTEGHINSQLATANLSHANIGLTSTTYLFILAKLTLFRFSRDF